jgi:tRNA (guanine37-N1)-methyltransferase
MLFHIVTLCPEAFSSLNCGVIGRALKKHPVMLWQPRNYSLNKHRQVDDKPYGSGPGQIMQAEPLMRTLESIFAYQKEKIPVWLTSPQGQSFTQQVAVKHAAETPAVAIVCGRYQGIDQRFIDQYVDAAWSVGHCVVSGGELPAMMMIDALLRQQPGTLGNPASTTAETFSTPNTQEHPHYTTPKTLNNQSVPDALLSGDPKKIALWRNQKGSQQGKKTP